MKNRKKFRAMSFTFEKMEPGEVTTVESSDERILSPSRVLINRSAYAGGVQFDSIEVDGVPYGDMPTLGNPTYISGDDIPAGAKISLGLRNVGVKPVHPSVCVFFEIVDNLTGKPAGG